MDSILGNAIWAVVALCFVAGPIPARAQAEPGEALVISDIHFDPFFDAVLFPRLVAEPAERWGEVLHGSGPGGINPRGTDSNDALLQGGLDEVLARCPRPSFILYPGDLMAHQWQAKYDRLSGRSHLQDPGAYKGFTTKAIRYLAGEFRRRYPRTPILPTPGNDDSYCGDYRIEPEGPFLAMFAAAWLPLLGPGLDAAAFRETFVRGGYYSIPLPDLEKHRLVVLNSIVFSVNYDNSCGTGNQTPALDQFHWLAATLKQAEEAGESVWLLMHIPPGVNSFNSAEDVLKGGQPATFWQPELTSQFVQLVHRHRAQVRMAFAGHTHMDDFRVLQVDGTPALLVKIVPAISPIFGNNPGFQVFQFDRVTGAVLNYQTYAMANLAEADQPLPRSPGKWTFEYDFRAAYGSAALSAATATRLAEMLQADPTTRERYAKFYSVGAAPEFTTEMFGIYRCAIANVTPAEFLMCLTGSPRPKAPRPHPDRSRPMRILTRP